VQALLHSVYDQPDAASVHAQFERVLDAVAEKLPKVAEHLDTARADVLAFTPGNAADTLTDHAVVVTHHASGLDPSTRRYSKETATRYGWSGPYGRRASRRGVQGR
jgi:hypothetical protein